MTNSSYAALSKEDKILIDSAEAAMMHGYAPYTKFYVGAAVRTKSGRIYVGSNIETASYVAVCAERSAISAAVSDGEYEFTNIAVISKSDHFDVKQVSGPCGICRQLIFEFSQVAGNDTKIINSATTKHDIIVATISELMPLCWGPDDTGTDISKYQTSQKS